MNNTYKFYQNEQCEYFPCHDVADSSSFNCLFCYCPLYLKENCLGHPDYILNTKGQRIRDCSGCTVVHRPEMYEKQIDASAAGQHGQKRLLLRRIAPAGPELGGKRKRRRRRLDRLRHPQHSGRIAQRTAPGAA